MNPEQDVLFEVPSPIVPKVKRASTGAGKPRWSKYRPVNPVKCDDCMLLLALTKGKAPRARSARWRRKCGDVDLLLCQGHADQRREEDGMPGLKGYGDAAK